MTPDEDGLLYSCAYIDGRQLSEDGASAVQPKIRNTTCTNIGWFSTELKCAFQVRSYDYAKKDWWAGSHWTGASATFHHPRNGRVEWCWDTLTPKP